LNFIEGGEGYARIPVLEIKHDTMFNQKLIAVVVLSTAGLISCDDSDVQVQRDYFPVAPGKVRSYETEYYQPYTPGSVVTDTISIIFTSDTLIAGKMYHVEQTVRRYTLYDGTKASEKSVSRLIRKEGNRWYVISPGTDGPENLFLDGDANVGHVHVINQPGSGDFKVEHTVVAKGTTHIIHGVRYTGVIEIEEVGYWRNSSKDRFTKSHVQRRWFAPGVGEIYSAFEAYVYTVGIRHFLLPR
jgi:hypothetical protein